MAASGLDYGSVSVPARSGTADDIVPLHHAEYVAGAFPTAELLMLDGVGHLHTAERWREFLTAARN